MTPATATAAPRRVTITSFDDLRLGLRSTDSDVRHAVLRALGAAPTAALAYRAEDGRDVIDELLDLTEATRGALEHPLVVSTLLRFTDERVVPMALEVFELGRDERLALVAAERIATLDAPERRARLVPIAMGSERPSRARAAANLLADLVSGAAAGPLPVDVALRVALVSDHAVPLPELTPASLIAWCRELDGPWRRSARDALERRDPITLAPLWSAWDDLGPSVRMWLLSVGARRPTPAAIQRARAIVAGARIGDADMREPLAALALLASVRQRLATTEARGEDARLRRLLAHPDARVQAAAIAAGAPIDDWQASFAAATGTAVRLALVTRLYERGDEEALDLLETALADPAWQVRSRAAGALGHLGAPAELRLRRVLAHGHVEAQMAAAQGLMAAHELGSSMPATVGPQAPAAPPKPSLSGPN